MNSQFKKGVLELIVLESVRTKDMYGYELVEEVSKVVDVKEGTIYPLLLWVEKKNLITATYKESPLGPKRKYYSLTPDGKEYVNSFYKAWQEITESVEKVFE